MFYPDHYNGAFIACPDPVDFRAYTNINLYKDKNAFFIQGPHTQVAQPDYRDYLGHTIATTQSANQYELALGDHARSGEQFDIWQAVYGPVGPDGYPAQIFNKETGEIDPKVAAYWKEHYDLSDILQRNWPTLGPKLRGKLRIYVGSADNYMLNNAVYLIEDFLKSTTNPPYEGEVKYGDRAEHCWNGDPTAAQLSLAPPLQHHVRSDDPRPHPENRPRRSRPYFLALLIWTAAPPHPFRSQHRIQTPIRQYRAETHVQAQHRCAPACPAV